MSVALGLWGAGITLGDKPQGDAGEGDAASPERSDAVAAATTPVVDAKRTSVLLITADQLAAAWEPFARWKTRGGKRTKILTVDRIDRAYRGENIQEKIRRCVRDHIDNHGTRWVVLGGDSLPGGKGLVPGGHRTVHAQEQAGIPTDIVYLSKTNWDADGDGVYGEWEDDRDAISYPDGTVGLGRVPVRTAADVAAFTDKVVAYESRYPATDFAKQMIYTCTVSPAYPKVRRSWDGFVSKAWEGGRVGRFFSRETPWDKEGRPGSHELSAGNLTDLINGKTTGKLHIHGHGHLPSWVLERSTFTAGHVAQLKNDGAYPLITTVSCNTGEYDSRTDPSIVELMIRRPKGGSVAVVAPVRTGKPHFHSRSDFRLMVTEGKLDGTTQTMTRYWCNGLGGGLTTGEALMKAKFEMIADARKSPGYHLCISELNLLGDPTLDMRADSPRTPKIQVLREIRVGRQVIEILTGAPGGTVCLWKGEEIYEVARADDSGKATLNVAAVSPGELLVTVSGPSLNTATATITVAASK
ncbi:MAG: C25 family cysteine peptidase [Phycisphaerae bacterium]|nr:C25 family cysteine peptidase [Phycisphaerae bacterium]